MRIWWLSLTSLVVVILGIVAVVPYLAAREPSTRDSVIAAASVMAALATAIAAASAAMAAHDGRRAATDARRMAEQSRRALALHDPPRVTVHLQTESALLDEDARVYLRVEADPRQDVYNLQVTWSRTDNSITGNDRRDVLHRGTTWEVELGWLPYAEGEKQPRAAGSFSMRLRDRTEGVTWQRDNEFGPLAPAGGQNLGRLGWQVMVD